MGGTVSSRCAAPPLRSGPSGDTAPPMAKRVATAGRVLPAIAGPACHGERWIAGGRQRLSLVARCDVERDGEQVGPTRPEPVEPHRPARPYPCAGGRARISSGPGSDSPPAQRPDICVHPTPPPRGDTPLQSGADHICGRPHRDPRSRRLRDGTSPSPTVPSSRMRGGTTGRGCQGVNRRTVRPLGCPGIGRAGDRRWPVRTDHAAGAVPRAQADGKRSSVRASSMASRNASLSLGSTWPTASTPRQRRREAGMLGPAVQQRHAGWQGDSTSSLDLASGDRVAPERPGAAL